MNIIDPFLFGFVHLKNNYPKFWSRVGCPKAASEDPDRSHESCPPPLREDCSDGKTQACYSTINHKNYNFLDCDWFKKLQFSTNSLAKLLSDSLLLDSLLSDSSISQSHSKLYFKSPITFKVVVTCVRACVRACVCALLCFWRLIAGRRRGDLRMFRSPL